MATFFTSDWHLNETRIFDFNPFFRNFKSIEEQNECIINRCNDAVGEDDTLYHIGDVSIDEDGIKLMDKIKCKRRMLIIGNYDEDKIGWLSKYFDEAHTAINRNILGTGYHLNHYPLKANPDMMNIVGHIHGLWKVQPNMINVGVDAWDFRPLDENRIKFVTTAIQNYYDGNVFPLLKQ